MKKKIVILMLVCSMIFSGCAAKKPASLEETMEGIETAEESIKDVEDEEESNENIVVEEPEITIVMVGDMLMHDRVEESALQEDGTYSYDAIFANVLSELQSADLAIANQEVILGGKEIGVSGYPCFNAPYELGDDLVEAGFDVVCHGTNHAMDKGKKGLINCLNFWKETYPDIGVLGIHSSREEQENIYLYEQDGMKIAILNFTYGTNGIDLPADMPYAVDLMEENAVVAALTKAEELADFTIVCPHWGTEYELGVSSQQKKWTNLFLEYGVDLVIGTHPHVIEPIEMIYHEETGEPMLVYYSIGNFVNWTSGTGAKVSNRMVGGMAQITIGKGIDGKPYIKDYGVDPVICHLEEGTNGVTVYFLKDYSVILAEKNAIRKQDDSFSLDYCIRLCDEVWADLWKK